MSPKRDDATRRHAGDLSSSAGDSNTADDLETMMSNVNLTRLWYIFPADDQELKPHEFERKVTSFLRGLSPEHKLAVLDFLSVQYGAFQDQLRVMRERTVLSQREHCERWARLHRHVQTLRACRRAVESSARLDTASPANAVSPREHRL